MKQKKKFDVIRATINQLKDNKYKPVIFKAKSIPLPFKVSKAIKDLFPSILK